MGAEEFPVPPPRFARAANSGPGAQPGPPGPQGVPTGAAAPVVVRRWVRCQVDHHLHLLRMDDVAAVWAAQSAPAFCGRLISPAGLTLSSESQGLCVSCVAARCPA